MQVSYPMELTELQPQTIIQSWPQKPTEMTNSVFKFTHVATFRARVQRLQARRRRPRQQARARQDPGQEGVCARGARQALAVPQGLPRPRQVQRVEEEGGQEGGHEGRLQEAPQGAHRRPHRQRSQQRARFPRAYPVRIRRVSWSGESLKIYFKNLFRISATLFHSELYNVGVNYFGKMQSAPGGCICPECPKVAAPCSSHFAP